MICVLFNSFSTWLSALTIFILKIILTCCDCDCDCRLSGLKKPSASDTVTEQVKEEEGVSEDEASEQDSDEALGKVHLTPLELEGLWNLLGKLEALPSNKKCVPAGMHNATALLTHIKV